ncbi:MAG: amidase, partial [Steroidobacteraceae bacterium]
MRAISIFLAAFALAGSPVAQGQGDRFHLQEVTIDGIHAGIRAGEVTCKQIVQGYVARATQYNGVCTKLVTADGAKIPAASGTVRAGAALKFPTDTVAVSA